MEQVLNHILEELQELKKGQANLEQKVDKNFIILNGKIDRISKNMSDHHIENINTDVRILNEILLLKESVTFINRKVADAELEINTLKHNKQ